MGDMMQALRIERYGGPEVIQLTQLPVPEILPGTVLVRLTHSGINFMDIHTHEGKYATSQTYRVKLPVTLGIEGAGEVAAVGEGVESFRVGQRVAYCLVWGSYAQYALVPAERLLHIPDNVSNEMAAAALFHGLTAHYLAHDVGALRPGATCLVHAASGGIGQILTQMAKRMGATVYATASTEAKLDQARERGADHAMLYDAGGFADRILDLTDGRGVDMIFDSVGRDTLRDSFRTTRKKGLVINYGTASGAITDLNPIELGEAGSLFLTRPRLADHVAGDQLSKRAADIFSGLAQGWLTIDICGRYRLDDVHSAHQSLVRRGTIGKPILQLAED